MDVCLTSRAVEEGFSDPGIGAFSEGWGMTEKSDASTKEKKWLIWVGAREP